jgi:hypothetical protein
MRFQWAIVRVSALLLLQLVSGWALANEKERTLVAPRVGHGEQTERRREQVFFEAELGPAYVDTIALKDDDLLDRARFDSSGFGLVYGAAIGVRMQQFWVGGRYRRGNFSDWKLWTLGGEAGLKFSIGRFAPHVSFGVGSASLDGLAADISRVYAPVWPPAVDIHGLNARLMAGLDYYLSRWFSVGASVSGDAFFLRRRGDGLVRLSSSDPGSAPSFPEARDGSGNGLGVALTLVLGLHY